MNKTSLFALLALVTLPPAMAAPPPAAVHKPVAQGYRGPHPGIIGGPATQHRGVIGGPVMHPPKPHGQ